MEIWNSPELKIEPLNENAPKVFQEVVSKLQFYWVSAGTALGLYRDKDFIPGDTDLDFALIGYDGIMNDLIIALGEDYKLVRSIIYEGKPMQLAFMRKGVLVDFYFHYPNTIADFHSHSITELDENNYVNFSESGMQLMPKAIYENLETVETKYGKVSFVKDIENYLTIRYGEDWKIPQEKKPKFSPIF